MPIVYESVTIKQKMACGRNLYVTLLKDEQGKIVKVIIHLGKSGQCHRSILEGMQNLINELLRNGHGIETVVSCLKGLRCDHPTPKLLSCPDFIAKLLEGKADGGER